MRGALRILIGIPGDGRTEVSVRRTWLGGGPRPQILGGGRKKMGKWIVQLCVAAVPTRRGRAGSQLQPCVGVG